MADMLSVSVSGLRAFQRALETTSHNIANASTPGYSRQRVDMVTQKPEAFGGNTQGSGVAVGGISRYSNDLLNVQMQRASSSFSRLDAYSQKADALNNLFADSTTGLSASLARFSNALQGVADTPTSTAARQALLSEANGLVQRFQTYDLRINELEAEVNEQVSGEASAITSIAANIARLNQEIAVAQSQNGGPSGDLLDARDKQLTDLAARIDTSIVRQDDGSVNVFIGNGQALVVGSTAATLVARPDALVPSRLTLTIQSPGVNVDIGGSVSGGSVGGVLDFRRELLDPARNQIGQIAAALADVTNSQHREGIDLAGNMGGNLFAIGGVDVLAQNTNAGTGAIAATRTNISSLTSYDYVLRYTGSGWTAQQADTGAFVAFTGTGTNVDPIVLGGVSMVLSGTPAAGDRFLVRPTAGAINGMGVLISDSSRVAAAAPIRTAAIVGNAGSATISAGEVLDAGNAQLRSPVSLQFINSTTYSINGAGSFAYTPGGNIDVNGWRVQISGAPAAGDSFTVSDNTGGVGDNRNALEMVGGLARGVLSGGADSLNVVVGKIIGAVGVASNQANTSLDAQRVIYDQSRSAADSVSGVNLDEEAGNMMRYQQAYQAAAQMIRTTQTIFDTLLGAVRR